MKQWVTGSGPGTLAWGIERGEERPLECMQHAGDVIFVPHRFGHGTINTQASVGIAVEMESACQDAGVIGIPPRWH
jgi:oxalate decarboxylase/phosphoglucose isomerase-like protein (cupin superfamily)